MLSVVFSGLLQTLKRSERRYNLWFLPPALMILAQQETSCLNEQISAGWAFWKSMPLANIATSSPQNLVEGNGSRKATPPCIRENRSLGWSAETAAWGGCAQRHRVVPGPAAESRVAVSLCEQQARVFAAFWFLGYLPRLWITFTANTIKPFLGKPCCGLLR